jgi:glycosyltransferase involved in cell wall biosynthesis
MLSVVVPVGKMQGDIENLSHWIREITTQPVEVTLVHDKQDDETGPKLASLIADVPNLKLQLVEGYWSNPGEARNAGLAEATQEWITFWDADDLPCLNTVLEAIAQLNTKTDVVIGQYLVRKVIHSSNSSKISNTHCIDDLIINPGLWRMVFRREVFTEFKFPNICMAEDQVYLVTSRLVSREIEYSPKLFYTYFLGHPNQLTMNPVKILDLHNSLSILSLTFHSLNEIELRFSRLLYLRQFNTLLKNSHLNDFWGLVRKFHREYLGDFPYTPWSKIREILTFYKILVLTKLTSQ